MNPDTRHSLNAPLGEMAAEMTELGIETLAMAWLKFDHLAGAATDAEMRDNLRLAARIADSLSNPRPWLPKSF